MTPDAVLIETIDRHFGAHPSTEKIGVAVSGGSDSLALLYLLVEWGRASLSVATVNHGLRVSAAGEAAQVGRICEELGLSHTTLEWQGWDGRGNLQDHARRIDMRCSLAGQRKGSLIASPSGIHRMIRRRPFSCALHAKAGSTD